MFIKQCKQTRKARTVPALATGEQQMGYRSQRDINTTATQRPKFASYVLEALVVFAELLVLNRVGQSNSCTTVLPRMCCHFNL